MIQEYGRNSVFVIVTQVAANTAVSSTSSHPSTRSVGFRAELVILACMQLGQQRSVTQSHTDNFVLMFEPSSIAEEMHGIKRASDNSSGHKK